MSSDTGRLTGMTKIVDPPAGWLFGFPAPLQENYEVQLREAGYPEKDIPFALKHSRYWETDEDG